MAKTGHDGTYRIAEFARLAGVTVRALHHYDRLGLLKPRRTDAGYRAYTARDLETLEQIVALKFIGIPLRKIPSILRAASGALADALAAQRRTLEAKRQLIARAIDAIGAVEATLRAGHHADAGLYRRIIEVIEMQHDEQAWMKQYGELVDRKMAHLKSLPKETLAALRQEWIALIEEIKPSLDEDPAGPKAQAFADRWLGLLKQVSGVADESLAPFVSAPQLRGEVERFTKDLSDEDRARASAAWQPFADTHVWEFIQRALATRV